MTFWKDDVMYCEVNEDFNTEYPTWVIAFCPDTNSFFVTNQRHFFWQYNQEFWSEKEAIDFFENHICIFVKERNEIAKRCGGIGISNNIFLEDTMKMYTGAVHDID